MLDISVKEGETVPVNSVVAVIGEAGSAVDRRPRHGRRRRRRSCAAAAGRRRAGVRRISGRCGASRPLLRHLRLPRPRVICGCSRRVIGAARQRSSPLVRRIAKEHNVDVAQIAGSGIGGRVTKHDILSFIEQGPPRAGGSAWPVRLGRTDAVPMPAAVFRLPNDRVEPMSVMRKKIAEHMVLSKHTSAHVYSVFEVNYSRVDQIRKAKKDEYERMGAKLTFTSFIAKAAVDCLRRHPMINASIDGDNVIYRGSVNLGIAVALDNGLIVPVVKGADEKNTLGLSRAIQDVADRARAKKLSPEEVQGGTFTITNPGNFGRAVRPAGHQPAAGGDPRRRHDREARGRDRRHDRHPPDGLPDARLRPPAGGRRRRRPVHGRPEEER